MRPLIGITSRYAHSDDAPVLSGARLSYIQSVEAAGGIPVIIPLIENIECIHELYERLDGVLLPGGEDVDPKFYGEAPHPKLDKVCTLRDELEIKIVRWAEEEDKPLLGICRGIQVMNVASGGTLYQDLESQIGAGKLHTHFDVPAAWTKRPHDLLIENRSTLATLLDSTKLSVNSLHHQAIKDVAPKLKVVGRSPDEVVEAVELPEHRFFVGVQCHPEMLWQEQDKRWLQMFSGFVKASLQYQEQHKRT